MTRDVNTTTRSGIVEVAALAEALRQGRIGAGIAAGLVVKGCIACGRGGA